MIPLGAGPIVLLTVLALLIVADLVLALVGRRP